MIWDVSAFLLSAIYLGMIWFANSYPDNFFWPGLIFILALFISIKYISKKYSNAILPALLAIGTVYFLPLIDSSIQVRIFMIISVGVFYFGVLAGLRLSKYKEDKTAKAMYNLVAFAVLFCWFASGYGWYLNIEIQVWVVMFLFAVIAFSVSYILLSLDDFGLNRQKKVLYSVFMAYLMAGIVWIEDFWPFGYLTTGVVALIIYYSAWDVIRNYFRNKLTFRKIIASSLFLIGAIAIILMSTNWYPVV